MKNFSPMALDLKGNLMDRLRLASILDGISYLILLGIAMPLKYWAGMPMAVRITGSLHGFFFLALMAFLLLVWWRKRLSLAWCVVVFVCALVPLAPFFLEAHLRRRR